MQLTKNEWSALITAVHTGVDTSFEYLKDNLDDKQMKDYHRHLLSVKFKVHELFDLEDGD